MHLTRFFHGAIKMTQAKFDQPRTSSDPEMVFILSTGRSGTKTIADFLSALDGCKCLHEPEPRLIRESSAFRYGRLSKNQLAAALRQSRPAIRESGIYGESNQTLSLIIPALHEAFPLARYIWLIRNGIDVVASAVGRNWYTGLSMDGQTYEQSHRIGQEWIDGRVQGDQCHDVPESEWQRMSPFQKCCWYWGYLNGLIEKDLQSLVQPSGFRLIRLEDLEASAGTLASWIGLKADGNLPVPHQNRAHYSVYASHSWSNAEWNSFEHWCGTLMDRFYPSWRQKYKTQRQIACAEDLIESGQLKQAEELLNFTFTPKTLEARAHNSLGVLHYKRGDVQKAKNFYEKAVTEDPENTCFMLNLADFVFIEEHRPEAAIELYLSVLKRDSNNIQALMNIFAAYMQLRKSAEAQEILKSLQKIAQGRPELEEQLQQLHAYSSSLPAHTPPTPPPQDQTTETAAPWPQSANSGTGLPSDKARELEVILNRLTELGWSSKLGCYREYFSYCRKLRTVTDPKISIIVISWREHPDTLKSFEILEHQRQHNFELIFVDNGSPNGSFNPLVKYIDTYVRLNANTGAYLARNIGAVFAGAPILFFLEDDGVPADGIVSAHLDAHQRYDVVSVRGVYLPKSKSNPMNLLAKHYYLGDRPFPWHVNLEGNASYRAEAFFAVGGWDDDNRFGYGGPELSRRLLRYEADWCKQIYSPEPVIMHDYANDQAHLQQKLEKQRSQIKRIEEKQPGFKEFLREWQQYYLRTDLIKERHADLRSASDALEPSATSTRQAPFISIVIPTHNRCFLLKQALESALSQTAGNYEVIVMDDGSEDETQDLIRSFSCDRLHYRKKAQTGAPDTRNCGIEEAHGEYILWLDDDDVLSADTVKTHSAVLARNPEVDVVYGALQYFDGNSEQKLRLFDPKDWSMNGDMLLSSLVAGCCIPNPGTLVRRSCYRRIGRYDDSFSRAHDYEFWTRAASQLKFRKNYTIVCRYRIHTSNMSAGNMVDRSFESKIIRRMVAHYGLRRIYHWFDWSNPEAAEGAALYIVASDLFKIGDVYQSARLLEQIPIHLWTADIAELSLNCLLFQGRWKRHGDLLEQVRERSIIPPSGIKLIRQAADRYWRLIQGLRQALNKKNQRKIAAFLDSIQEKTFYLTPDCAVRMISHLSKAIQKDNEAITQTLIIKILRETVMVDPTHQFLDQELPKIPLSEIERGLILATRQRMLTTFNESDLKDACGGRS